VNADERRWLEGLDETREGGLEHQAWITTEAAIDRAAQAFYELALGKAMFAGRDGPEWSSMSDADRKCWRDDMRPIVKAVLSER
jgi:hypothetical protein